MSKTYGVFHNETGERVFTDTASSEEEALDLWAAYRSGYGTLAEMARSAIFREFANVMAYPVAA